MSEKQVRFFPIYHPQTLVRVGEIKHDPFRKELKWTALSDTGHRVGDFATRLQASNEVISSAAVASTSHEKKE